MYSFEWDLLAELSYHCTYMTENFSLIAHLYMKLYFFKDTNHKIGCMDKTPFCKSGHIYSTGLLQAY